MYHRLEISEDELNNFKSTNYRELKDDRLRCHKCQGFYWRVWYDMIQCLACQSYTVIETAEIVKPVTIGLGTFNRLHGLLQVDWVREQLMTKTGLDISKRIKDPLSDRGEFIVFPEKLRCRVTGTEVGINPPIIGSWILLNAIKDTDANQILSPSDALKLVKQQKENQNGGSGRAA